MSSPIAPTTSPLDSGDGRSSARLPVSIRLAPSFEQMTYIAENAGHSGMQRLRRERRHPGASRRRLSMASSLAALIALAAILLLVAIAFGLALVAGRLAGRVLLVGASPRRQRTPPIRPADLRRRSAVGVLMEPDVRIDRASCHARNTLSAITGG